MLLDTVRHSASSPCRRRHDPDRLDAATLAALRDLLAPPAESEADAERGVAAIMARIHAANGERARALPPRSRR